jgi:hypothetical protein
MEDSCINSFQRNHKEGNVVIGFTSDYLLMLDCDLKRIDEVKWFAPKFGKKHDLGSSLIIKTTDTPQVDLFGKPLGNYAIVYGKRKCWDAIKWLVGEAYRLGIVNKAFARIRQVGSITIRVNAKNEKIPPPKPIAYFDNGDDTGIMEFLDHWIMCRKMG